ncbi:50S ribosomal protein L23 [Candidatus Kapabacteria bacterium]|nr:50S ribosomal protein L23 [Candidatus Kapabacteria bacterium]
MTLIRKPILTEKAMQGTEERKYQFYVDPKANKIEIKKAVEHMFDVKVDKVNTANVKGKVKKRFTKRGLMVGKAALRKKAYVTLQEGFEIDIVSGAGEE